MPMEDKRPENGGDRLVIAAEMRAPQIVTS